MSLIELPLPIDVLECIIFSNPSKVQKRRIYKILILVCKSFGLLTLSKNVQTRYSSVLAVKKFKFHKDIQNAMDLSSKTSKTGFKNITRFYLNIIEETNEHHNKCRITINMFEYFTLKFWSICNVEKSNALKAMIVAKFEKFCDDYYFKWVMALCNDSEVDEKGFLKSPSWACYNPVKYQNYSDVIEQLEIFKGSPLIIDRSIPVWSLEASDDYEYSDDEY
jgi:hypothetical protein